MKKEGFCCSNELSKKVWLKFEKYCWKTGLEKRKCWKKENCFLMASFCRIMILFCNSSLFLFLFFVFVSFLFVCLFCFCSFLFCSFLFLLFLFCWLDLLFLCLFVVSLDADEKEEKEEELADDFDSSKKEKFCWFEKESCCWFEKENCCCSLLLYFCFCCC